MFRILACAALLSALVSPASAQQAPAPSPETVATTRAAATPILSAESGPLGQEDENADVRVLHLSPCTPGSAEIRREAEADGVKVVPDKTLHGSVSAAIGSRGYRAASGTVCAPMGKSGSVTVSIGESRYGGRRHY